MPTPLVAPSPFGRSREYAALNQGMLQNLATQTGMVGEAQAANQKANADIATTMLSNADDLASVFGGMQTGAGLENYLNLPSLRGLQDTTYQGGMTGALDAMRLAVLSRKASGGGGGGKGGDKPFKGEGIPLLVTPNGGGEPYYVIGEPADFTKDMQNTVLPVQYDDIPDNTPVYNFKVGQVNNSNDYKRGTNTPIDGNRGNSGGGGGGGATDFTNMSDEELERIANGG